MPFYLKRYDQIEDSQVPCPKRLRALLFPVRKEYIAQFAPFVDAAETEFTEQLLATHEEEIKGDDIHWRKWLFDLHSIGDLQQTQGGLHIWARPFHISQGRWGMPCLRCKFLHKAMWNWDVAGRKCVAWRREYCAMNCAEPLALAMAYRRNNEGRIY